MEEKEVRNLLAAEESRLRRIWKQDFQAAFHVERVELLERADRMVKEITERVSRSITDDLRERLHKQSVDAQEFRQKTHRELIGLADNLEERVKEQIKFLAKQAIEEVLAKVHTPDMGKE